VSPSGSERPRISVAGYGGPAPANHGERHPAPGNYAPANSVEPENAELRRVNEVLRSASAYFASEIDPTRRRS
jgi:transposase